MFVCGDGAMRRAVKSGLANHDGAGRKTLEKQTAKLTATCWHGGESGKRGLREATSALHEGYFYTVAS